MVLTDVPRVLHDAQVNEPSVEEKRMCASTADLCGFFNFNKTASHGGGL
jgi:hypothetical protein